MEEEVEDDEDLNRCRADERCFDPKLKPAGHVHQNSGEVSLREWLDKPKRPVDFVECLHIFRQVVEAVNLAHSQGVVVNNIRPSCFVLSALNRVSFIESASCSDTSCGDEEGSYAAGAAVAPGDQMTSMESVEGKRELHVVSEADETRDFPLKKILSMEFTWYASPEEVEGRQSLFASDVYKLGVLLFELFCMFETLEEKLSKMSNLRDRVLPPQMLLKWPKEASFCLWLLHPQPSSRPTLSELLESEFLNEELDSLEERGAAIKLKEEIEELELLLDFLLGLQTRKIEAAHKLHDTICFLCADIEEVENQRSSLMKNGCSFLGLEKGDHGTAHKFECPLPCNEINEDSFSSGSRKRIRPGHKDFMEEKFNENHLDVPRPDTNQETHEKISSKSSRILKNFSRLEEAYFSSRYKTMRPIGQRFSSKMLISNPSSGSTVRTDGSSADYLASKKGNGGSKMSDLVNPFLNGLCKYLSFSKFKVRAEVKQGDLLNSSNLICSLSFDRDKEFFATAGVNRKIKVFECDAILNEEHNIHYPVAEMTSRSKLSNVCWNGYIKSQIASSDFEGVVQVWDVSRSEVLVEMREHEKRVWSVNYSPIDPTKLASGSDDGTVKLWNINQAIVLLHLGGSTGTIITKANVCSVQFPPDSANLLAIGSADHNVYYYDLRNVRLPLLTLAAHARTVSYVKFIDSSTLVSSSTDNSLKLWDLTVSSSGVIERPVHSFTGHTNVKNFVGLSVSDGYIATGSETNEVFVYHKAFPMPMLSYRFGSIDPISGREADDSNQFISCLCWRGESHSLVAANSTGNIEILEMV
ncbi:Protein SPA1-RELATED 3 [Dendrobium catenatum]|uniref:Protein SPA1-RELATED 3 n=1 Tax=Dendrobium catenatum TaxID=906689 RepID=A0A2I0WGY8_9ASPA|nr:Protein SPA1-RELATED 3 [Dendrobium catenatum]